MTGVQTCALPIFIGDDASLRTLNDQVPGTGKFYPSDSAESTPQTADAGWFVAVGGQLYGPNFEEHPAGTATSSLGAEIAYTPISRSEEHTSELQSLMRISYAVFCLQQKTINNNQHNQTEHNNK